MRVKGVAITVEELIIVHGKRGPVAYCLRSGLLVVGGTVAHGLAMSRDDKLGCDESTL